MSLVEPPAPARAMTVEDILALPDDGVDREIIRGELRERPRVTLRNRWYGRTQVKIARHLDDWLDTQPKPRGYVLGGEAGFRLRRDPDTFVGVDVAFASAELAAATPAKFPYYEGAPVLAIEILSMSDQHGEIVERVELYLEAGSVVWVVDPDFRTMIIYRPGEAPEGLNVNQELSGEPYLPGFRVSVAALFE